VRAQDLWPDLSSVSTGTGGGQNDAAVIVGIENYVALEKIPGARQNADDWQTYLTESRGVPPERVSLLRDNEATLESLREYVRKAASEAETGGTLWFIFTGHGAPSKDGKDGLLVGVDAQRKADSLFARSLRRQELLDMIAKGRQAKAVVLIDGCFSGRSSSGEDLIKGLQPLATLIDKPRRMDARTVLFTAARSDQFAGPLPKGGKLRPAFGYLILGALRGWGAQASDADGRVRADSALNVATAALRLARDRIQTPELATAYPGVVLSRGYDLIPDFIKIHEAIIDWVEIPGGTFMMGSEEVFNAMPVHPVKVKGFQLARTPVTTRQYRACVDAGACTPATGACASTAGFNSDDQPAICLRWDQAKAFSAWVGGRLPTEAEWEYAARSAGKDQKYPWGDEGAACERTVISTGEVYGCGRGSTWPVCSKPRGNTAQGLCDMGGNVGAWTQDIYSPSYEGAPFDGSAREDVQGSSRVVRGGSFVDFGGSVQVAARNAVDPFNHSFDVGFRPARSSPQGIQKAATREKDNSADQACSYAAGLRPASSSPGGIQQAVTRKKEGVGRNRTASQEELFGTWRNSALTTTLKPGGRFSSVHCIGEKADFKVDGKWFLRHGAIVWIYGEGLGSEDVNPIIEFEPDRFTIKEMSGSITTMERLR